MRIDGEDISKYGAREWNVEPSYSAITINSEWPEGSLTPVMLPSKIGLKKFKITLMFKGKSRYEIWNNSRKLCTRLLKPATVSFDTIMESDRAFNLVLTNPEQIEASPDRFHKTVLEVMGYEFLLTGAHAELTTYGTSFDIVNNGNVTVPVVIDIRTDDMEVSTGRIFGFTYDSLTNENKAILFYPERKSILTINGRTGLIENSYDFTALKNAFDKVDMPGVPVLRPGKTRISVEGKNTGRISVFFTEIYF